MDTLKWLEAKEPTEVNMAHWFAGALERGDLAMVDPELVHFILSELQVHGKLWLEDLLVEAARYGRVNLLTQHDYIILSCDQWGIVNGATYGLQLESIKWLCCHLMPRVDVLDLCYAIGKGRIDILQWVHDHLDARWAYESSTFIAKTDVVKWIFQRRSSWLDLDPSLLKHHLMSMAAEAGNLERVQWLDAQDGVGCSTKAMDLAAANGHLEVVQYLHFHRTEGCTAAAMTGALESGEVEIAMWLHSHRTEGFYDGWFLKAPLDSVRWLYEAFGQPATEVEIENAFEQGDLPRLKWLCAHYEGPHTQRVRTVHNRLVPWLEAYKSGHAISDVSKHIRGTSDHSVKKDDQDCATVAESHDS